MTCELTLDQAAGQVLLAGFPAGPPPPALLALAGRGSLGGFVLFRRNLPDVATTAALNQTLIGACPSDLPPWLALDQEGGRVARLGPPLLKLPAMRRLGQLDNPELTRRAAAVLGAQLRALGFNLDFAPVLDVDSNPDNPVIGDRSFAPDPERVIRHADAFAQGLMQAGVAACGKHFPGHGDTDTDSHLALPRLAHGRARLDRVELRPFAALAHSLPTLMTAHIVFGALDPDTPATLSPSVVQGLLRQELGFTGVIFSDDLEMKAIANHRGIPGAACDAIAAGCDGALICSDVQATCDAHGALLARANGDPEFATRLRDAAQRSLSTRRRYVPAVADMDALRAALDPDRNLQLQEAIGES